MQRSTSPASDKTPRRLPIVLPGQELSGKYPLVFERTVLRAQSGDPAHRSALNVAAALAQRALTQCLPPSSRPAALSALAQVRAWTRGELAYRHVRSARAELFEQVPALAEAASLLVRRALSATQLSPLQVHADTTVQRYVSLSVHHAIASVLLCLDGVVQLNALLQVADEAAAAIAFRDVGLGPARDEELRTQALQRAQWEQERLLGHKQSSLGSIALPLFHEFLGVHFNARASAQRLYQSDFIAWVYSEPAR